MGQALPQDEALTAALRRCVEKVQARFRDHWRRAADGTDTTRRRDSGGEEPRDAPDDRGLRRRLRRLGGRSRRVVRGTSPRTRYAEATELINLRDALIDLIRLLERPVTPTPGQRREAERISAEIDSWPPPKGELRQGPLREEPHREEVRQLGCDVEQLTIDHAEDGWLIRRLEQEAAGRSAVSATSGELQWEDVFADTAMSFLDSVKGSGDLEEARRRLRALTSHRAREARRRRADERVRAERLVFAGVLTLAAAVLSAAMFAWAVYWQGRSASGLGYHLVRSGLAVLAGALGGALARALRLRDAPLGTFETDRFRRAFSVQMALGGGLGVVALVLVEVGGLPRVGTGGDAAMVALYAFLAGWSEPFIFNVLGRLAPSEPADAHERGLPRGHDPS